MRRDRVHCRHFLNAYNSTLGGSRQVFTVPCYTIHIGNLKLCNPKSVSYPRVWIDFNLGTSSILILCQVESTAQPSHPEPSSCPGEPSDHTLQDSLLILGHTQPHPSGRRLTGREQQQQQQQEEEEEGGGTQE
ncbi:uncharacterized protein LOC126983380 [Eriocheir sinensis]|uniref:uncharacterized protein LOC126983380 n=1 Tax=Eriocheir sinensis TaxID=95602 RepID=UPI0021C7300C|nr:uncharacterized protein LOC126983380 [Eriocheir sinensis]